MKIKTYDKTIFRSNKQKYNRYCQMIMKTSITLPHLCTAFAIAFAAMSQGCSTISAKLPPPQSIPITWDQLINAPPSLPQLMARNLPQCLATRDRSVFLERANHNKGFDLDKSSWSVELGAIALPFGQHHLFVKLVQNDLSADYLRIDGISASLGILKKDSYYGLEFSGSAYGLSPNSLLQGIPSAPGADKCSLEWSGDNEQTNGKFIEVYRGDVNSALDFLAVAAQFIVANNSLQQPYALLGTNSNAFAYSLLTHTLGDKFNRHDVEERMKNFGWSVPGFGILLLPDAKFWRFDRKSGESFAETHQRLSRGAAPSPKNILICDPLNDLSISGFWLFSSVASDILSLGARDTDAFPLAIQHTSCVLSNEAKIPVRDISDNQKHPNSAEIKGLNDTPVQAQITPSRSSQARPPYRSRQAQYAPRAYASQGL